MANVGEEKALWLLRLHALADRGEWVRKGCGNEFSLVVSPIIFPVYNSISIFQKLFQKPWLFLVLGTEENPEEYRRKENSTEE